MNRLLGVLLRVLVPLSFALTAAASVAAEPPSPTLEAIKQRKAIVIGYLKDAYPMSFVGQDGQPTGFSIELCRAIAADVGKAIGLDPIKVQYVPVTLEGRFDAVASGAVDLE